MKKIFVLLMTAAMLCFTGCSDFLEWAEKEQDKTYIYDYSYGQMDEDQFVNAFTSKSGWKDDSLSGGGFVEDENCAKIAESFEKVAEKIDAMRRWSYIEDVLKSFDLTQSQINRIEWKIRSKGENGEIFYVNRSNYKWVHIKLVNIRTY